METDAKIPDKYLNETEGSLAEIIKRRKEKLGGRVVILGHNYQREEIYSLADFHGDSYGLARIASEQKNAKYIVFCGVRFMAETARVLAKPRQTVIHPNKDAGCPMAAMANISSVTEAWRGIEKLTDIKSVIPITYMNSDADLKDFCGTRGGLVCTSSNAKRAFEWAFSKADKILFFPDEHLGRNTANSLGIPKSEQVMWDWRNPTLGGLTPQAAAKARVILWKGYCHVHTWFTVEHIGEMRKKYPDIKILVHPECTEDVANASDEAGSTEFIKNFVHSAPSGSKIAIGTEIQMVSRLAKERRDCVVLPLSSSMCPNMYKINLQNLAYSLDNLGKVNVVKLPEKIMSGARLALERMLSV